MQESDNIIILLSGILFSPFYGCFAAGIGSALADLFSAYVSFAPVTFLVKGLMAVIAELIISCFFFETVFMRYGPGAVAVLPGNAVQETNNYLQKNSCFYSFFCRKARTISRRCGIICKSLMLQT